MPREYSNVHGQPGYWQVRFDDWNGWEAPHIHATQGDRELQVYTQTLEIKNQNGRFSNSEIEEIKSIARSYNNNYCLTINEDMFNIDSIDNIDQLIELRQILTSIVEPKKNVKQL